MKNLLILGVVLGGLSSVSGRQVIDNNIVQVKENHTRAIDLMGVGLVSTNGGNLNVRSKPTTTGSVLAKLANKTYVEVKEAEGSWYKVSYDLNKTGYVSKSYINLVSKDVRYVTASALNVRSSRSTSSSVLAQLYKSTYVGVISESNGWARIVFNGKKTGYVSSKYLSGSSTSVKYPKVSLSVVSFKQYDSRWASLKLGNSSTIFKKSGCTTTALAMTESVRLKKTITPLEYSKKMKYTSTGALYWPTSTYNVVTSSSSYLTKVYDRLKEGKPVVLGFKTKAGNQHYVTVTGYTGGASLVASGFLINDPGSSTRTKLSEIIASYPHFYKMVYAK